MDLYSFFIDFVSGTAKGGGGYRLRAMQGTSLLCPPSIFESGRGLSPTTSRASRVKSIVSIEKSFFCVISGSENSRPINTLKVCVWGGGGVLFRLIFYRDISSF